eukprot:CAMPEP_0170513170 /NCGR_PEP_ID=MMETSP0208-20121228/67253_1 /TAXON_ID=197538 /ORGANISM="Strombidium inclinatum, Strain S3" /LENGTH=66 /DNA_ID=CAMNT_0010796879 /DNA_START=1122 /DNA_END=1322 /DNA_ORIENTATION=-
MNVASLEEVEVKDYSLKTEGPSSVIFSEPVNDLFIVYWKEEGEEEDDEEQKEEDDEILIESQGYES